MRWHRIFQFQHILCLQCLTVTIADLALEIRVAEIRFYIANVGSPAKTRYWWWYSMTIVA